MPSLNNQAPGVSDQPPDDAAHASQSANRDAPQSEASPSTPTPRLGVIVSVDTRGRHELLRLAAGLAASLQGPTGAAIAQAIALLSIEPAPIERVVTSACDLGVVALVDGMLFALGRRAYLESMGIRPHVAEVRVAERIERSGDRAFFVVAVARAHCVGVFGLPNRRERPDIAPAG